MRTILTILKSPLIWRIMISLTVFLLLRELKAIHKEIGRIGQGQSLSRQQQVLLPNGTITSQAGILGLWQNNLAEVFPELRREVGTMNVRPGRVSAVSAVSFGQQKQINARFCDSIVWIPQASATGGGSIHYSHTINIER